MFNIPAHQQHMFSTYLVCMNYVFCYLLVRWAPRQHIQHHDQSSGFALHHSHQVHTSCSQKVHSVHRKFTESSQVHKRFTASQKIHGVHGRFNISKLLLNVQSALTRCLSTSPKGCLLYTSPSPRDRTRSRMPSSA